VNKKWSTSCSRTKYFYLFSNHLF